MEYDSTASCLQGRCSIHLSYDPIDALMKRWWFLGLAFTTLTALQHCFSTLKHLYQRWDSNPQISDSESVAYTSSATLAIGEDGGTRTHTLLLFRTGFLDQLVYQFQHIPKLKCIVDKAINIIFEFAITYDIIDIVIK